jgi:CheY-like chemotaxis protein
VADVLVLHVDDYAPGRHARTRTLEAAGFAVAEATTGSEALTLAAALSPAVILLDVNLPDMTGFEVCRRLKSAPVTRQASVVHISATTVAPSAQAAGIDGGADGYLVEPVEPAVLVATVNALVRARRAHDLAAARVARADALVAEAAAAARAAEAKLARLVGDLRQPVSTIVGWARTLRGTYHDPARLDQALAVMERNAQALGDRLDGAAPAPVEPGPALAGVHALVVEDETDTGELATVVLRSAGARVTRAASATEALGALETARFDVVVADITLPGDDGYELMRRIRRRAGGAVRAIALTGWVRPEDDAAARAAGFDAHMRKPADPGNLIGLVLALTART